ncbi:AcrR family transcriptional regulator [Nocardioides marinisabuli]|uniref:AcrR family transcriptional regulator n=1 Tax=Nocardioides marinisabuli TaxID=419476 RepID=A0A7Y9F0B8_9ACTN|nr:TetR family transcriptional regulator [Nocardioides marinisabuli]NYD57199.1 AcrR family transcriptional regulator [Nocardioides marinisabuli]
MATAEVPRTLTDKSARTQERIRAAAARILSERGIATARLGDIAAAAGVQAPAIYYYYASREELIEDVIRLGQIGTEARVTQAIEELDGHTPALEKICVAVEAHLRALHELSDYTTAAVRNVGQMPTEMRERMRADQRRYGRVWKRLFEQARDQGELRAGLDLRTAQLLVIGALNWTPEWWADSRVPLETLVTTACELTRHGLASDPVAP